MNIFIKKAGIFFNNQNNEKLFLNDSYATFLISVPLNPAILKNVICGGKSRYIDALCSADFGADLIYCAGKNSNFAVSSIIAEKPISDLHSGHFVEIIAFPFNLEYVFSCAINLV